MFDNRKQALEGIEMDEIHSFLQFIQKLRFPIITQPDRFTAALAILGILWILQWTYSHCLGWQKAAKEDDLLNAAPIIAGRKNPIAYPIRPSSGLSILGIINTIAIVLGIPFMFFMLSTGNDLRFVPTAIVVVSLYRVDGLLRMTAAFQRGKSFHVDWRAGKSVHTPWRLKPLWGVLFVIWDLLFIIVILFCAAQPFSHPL